MQHRWCQTSRWQQHHTGEGQCTEENELLILVVAMVHFEAINRAECAHRRISSSMLFHRPCATLLDQAVLSSSQAWLSFFGPN